MVSVRVVAPGNTLTTREASAGQKSAGLPVASQPRLRRPPRRGCASQPVPIRLLMTSASAAGRSGSSRARVTRVTPPSRTTRAIRPATGTTSRPGSASWSTSGCGSWRASAETRIRSHGAFGGPAQHLRVRSAGRRPRHTGSGDVLGAPLREVRLDLHADDAPGRADEVAEQRGRPPGARPDVEHAVAGTRVEQAEHVGDGARLGAGAPVADGQRPVVAGAAAQPAGQEARPRDRLEGLVDGVHSSSQPPRPVLWLHFGAGAPAGRHTGPVVPGRATSVGSEA